MALLDGTNAPTILVEFDYGNRAYFSLGVSPLGGADVLGGSAATNWQAVTTTDVRSISIRRGRSREDQSNQPGQLVLTLDNKSGNYDPDNSGSTYQWYSYSTLMRGMGIRVSAVYSAVTYILYVGFVEDIDVDVSLDPTVTFTATDSLAIFASQSLATIASAYSGDTTATRIGRYLDAIAFPSSQRTFTGTRTMQPTTLGATVLALCEEAAACEFGRFHIDRQGYAVLIPYENLQTTTNRFTLSDTRAANTIEYDVITTAPGAKYLINSCVLTQYSGYTQTSANTTSTARWGTYNRNVSAPLLVDAVAATMAGYYANRTSLPSTRVTHIEFEAPLHSPALWANVLATDLGDRVSVARTTIDARSLSYTCLVESLNHDITHNSWRVSLDLSPASF